jgi:hypothetical protein
MKKILLIIFLFAALVIILGAAGFFLLKPAGDVMVTSPLQPSATTIPVSPTVPVLEADTKSIKQLVSDFYATYTSCLKNPPSEATAKVSLYCQAHTGLTSEDFVANLQQGGIARAGADPIMCAQNPAKSLTVDTVDYEAPDRAVAAVDELFTGGFAQKIAVVVLKENNSWRVDMVSCPKP